MLLFYTVLLEVFIEHFRMKRIGVESKLPFISAPTEQLQVNICHKPASGKPIKLF